MRCTLATATGYRSPPPSRSVTPSYAKVSARADLCTTAHGQAWVGAGRSCLFSPREKIEMRCTLATATGYRSPPPSRSVTPSYAKVSARADLCTTAHGQAWVGTGRSCLFSPREKIEMRGTLATATGYRSPPPSRSVTPSYAKVSRGGDLCTTAHGQAWVGAGRSCLFSPREKIEMRGTLATATGYRSSPPSRSVTPSYAKVSRGREAGERAGLSVQPSQYAVAAR